MPHLRIALLAAACLAAAAPRLAAASDAGPALDADHPVPLDKKLSPEWIASLTARGKPSTWNDWTALQHIGMPAAGIGTGTVYLGGDGRLWGWDIFNQPHEGCVPNKVGNIKEPDGANYLAPPKMTSPWNLRQGLVLHVGGQAKTLDHTGFPQVTFTGEYPIGTVRLKDPASPVSAQIEAYSPFIPLAYDDSSLPLAILEVTLRNAGDQELPVELEAFLEDGALRLHDPKKTDATRVAQVMRQAGAALVQGTVEGKDVAKARDFGTLALAMPGEGAVAQARRGADGAEARVPFAEPLDFAVRRKLVLPAKGEAKATVLVAWNFPAVDPRVRVANPRRWYADKFPDAAAVCGYALRELPRLSAKTKLFRDTWYGAEEGANRGTLPHWLLERSLWTFSTMTTNGTYRLAGNRTWGWEGTGTCEGTCTHVWHYGQSMGRLFPQAEIDLRERTDFTLKDFHAKGAIGFRGERYPPAIDGQAGILLRCLREHRSDPSGTFLKRNWANIKKATEYLVKVEAEGKPGGNDGVFNKPLRNTLDANWRGEIPWLVSQYLAGLTASAHMAEDMGDHETAQKWNAIIAKGRAAYAGYFDAKDGYYKAKYTEKELLPVHVGPGCHIDQCLGDFWLAQTGLPPLGDKAQLRQAMDSLYRYNFVPDMGPFREAAVKRKINPGRHYAEAGESGLVMATWPHGGLPEQCTKNEVFMYFQECMSGFEHAAAALMVSLAENEKDPLLAQGLAVSRAVHDRYDAAKRNPYNEVECSDHYARAMSSYGVFVAATGFHGDASKGLLRFDPKIRPDDAAFAFVAPGAWGRYAQTRSKKGAGMELRASLEVRHGATTVATVEVRPPEGARLERCEAKLDGAPVALKGRPVLVDGRAVVALAQPVTVAEGHTLEILLADAAD